MAIVTLYDIDESELSKWAIVNCLSFQGWIVCENSDPFGFSNLDKDDTEWHIRFEFEFANEQEAMLFQLRWQGQ